jgi:hypothetical protein
MSNFPLLPGLMPNHDCTKTDHKKVSHVKQDVIKNAYNQEPSMFDLAHDPKQYLPPQKKMESVSHTKFPNHNGQDVNVQFEPNYAKLSNKVSILTYISYSYLCFRFFFSWVISQRQLLKLEMKTTN